MLNRVAPASLPVARAARRRARERIASHDGGPSGRHRHGGRCDPMATATIEPRFFKGFVTEEIEHRSGSSHHVLGSAARVLLITSTNRSARPEWRNFMRQILIAGSLALALAVSAPLAWAGNYPADNTGKNVRDRSGDTLTSGDQSENSADLTISQEIRKAIVADKSLSTNAHNVKIITSGGVVTLRGPVNTAAEKEKIFATAQRIAGVKEVQNQLEITSQ